MSRYDWSKLDNGWEYLVPFGPLVNDGCRFSLLELEEGYVPEPDCEPGYFALWRDALDQIYKFRIRDTERAPVDPEETLESIHQSFKMLDDFSRKRQRKHEATHGWRNPPSIYAEDRAT